MGPAHASTLTPKVEHLSITLARHAWIQSGSSFAPPAQRSAAPANISDPPNAVLMLAHRHRRWPNIKPALGERLFLLR